ncbi:hypothetical protein LUZ63_015817 [Rhynchospora breviuscula]|uniref:BCAS3 domain-containing protein n=1 Tax=Rhynchospora breviuscula TaxID=2022672 RepID=A0A9Q0HMK8_9POAL|nr:hypothetical protein LUZ63_015817 [Rhynchospora breviuscula]
MRNDEARGKNGGNRGFFSTRSLSSYMRFVSSGASTAASTIRSAGASIVSSIANATDDSTRDQVHWAGFDKLSLEPNSHRQVLLLAYQSGFQVWDVEQSGEVRQLASRHDGPVSFLQVQKNPISNPSNQTVDQFSDARPLLIVACDSTSSVETFDGGYEISQDSASEDDLFPTFVRFYSLKLHDYVHEVKFRSAVYSVRCSSRVVAVSQATQIHCFNAVTLEREYTILTLPISSTVSVSGGIGYGPLAVGPRWIAYTGSPVTVSDAGRVSPQILNPPNSGNGVVSGSVPNGSLVAHYAKESSRQLAAGIVILGDMGYRKLSEYLPKNGKGSSGMNGSSLPRANGHSVNIHTDNDHAGMVIVRDIVSKQVIVQFRAHTSPISALCFDPSGTLLVTASVHGQNINVFRIIPPAPNSESDASGTYIHLYRLQRGFTNAVIKDISFSDDSEWIMISSSRGTSHLFAISPYCSTTYLNDPNQSDNNSLILDNIVTTLPLRGPHMSAFPSLHRKSLSSPGPPVTLSVVSRIRNGTNGLNGLKGAVSYATGGPTNPISGAVASAFYKDSTSSTAKDFLLVFSPSGSIIQYIIHPTSEYSENGSENRYVVEPLQKWDVCHKKNRQDHGEIFDIYGEQEKVGDGNNMCNGSMKNNAPGKFGNEESRNLYYISEVELQTHIVEAPLWARSGMCFQVMSEKELDVSDNGETDIERVPTRPIEARSRNLIPVFDSLQMIRFHHSRVNTHGPLIRQRSTMSDESGGRLSRRSSCSSIDCSYSENGGTTVHRNNGSQTVAVNSNGGDHMLEARLQLVNNGVCEASDLLIPDLL